MMGKYILAHWCYSGNFGDALNPYLLEKLSGMKVKYCNSFKPDYKVELWQMIKTLLHLHRYNFRLLLPPEDTRPVVLAIGSILSRSICGMRSNPSFGATSGGYCAVEF